MSRARVASSRRAEVGDEARVSRSKLSAFHLVVMQIVTVWLWWWKVECSVVAHKPVFEMLGTRYKRHVLDWGTTVAECTERAEVSSSQTDGEPGMRIKQKWCDARKVMQRIGVVRTNTTWL